MTSLSEVSTTRVSGWDKEAPRAHPLTRMVLTSIPQKPDDISGLVHQGTARVSGME